MTFGSSSWSLFTFEPLNCGGPITNIYCFDIIFKKKGQVYICEKSLMFRTPVNYFISLISGTLIYNINWINIQAKPLLKPKLADQNYL